MSELALTPDFFEIIDNPAAIEAEMRRQALKTVESFMCDPLGFVQWAYPWGQPGLLERYAGPDTWQEEFLRKLGELATAQKAEYDAKGKSMPIRMARGSGHGIGKTTLSAWIVDWIMNTRPECRGTITSNTYAQLETKIWAAIQRWAKMNRMANQFLCSASGYYHRAKRENWFCAPQSCKEENSEAFAGQHASTSTSFYVFDEASAVPDGIWEVAEGGLTDGMPMIFAFGNPTRNVGKFFRICFGSEMNRWNSGAIDSRNCTFPNHDLHQQWLEDYGEDSDYFRVRVRGLPPLTGELQFIPHDLIREAQRRDAACLDDDPLIAGVDVSGGGSAWNVVRFRKGYNGQILPPIRISGEQGRDRNVIIGKLAEVLRDRRPEHKIDAMFVDSAYGAPIVERLRQLGFIQVHEVNFGGPSPDPHQANMRAYMWNRMKDWLINGSIDRKDQRLETDLGGPGAKPNRKNQLVLESKEDMKDRGVDSPDDGDALALTFARPVAPAKPKVAVPRYGLPGQRGWMS